MSRECILIVEDCEIFRAALTETLAPEYRIDSAADPEIALEMLSRAHYDLIISDVRMPKMDGFKFCASLKANSATAHIIVIFMSGHADVEDKLIGFSVGAKDFLIKPCDSRELKARIKIQLQERPKSDLKSLTYEMWPFRVDMTRQKAFTLESGGQQVLELSTLEFKLLHYFLTHPEHVLTRHQLLDGVWGEGCHVTDRCVDTAVSKLRNKLGAQGRLLRSVRGQGYCFESLKTTLAVHKASA